MRLIMATSERVELIRSLALEVKYSEEITIFMDTLPVLLVELRDYKVRGLPSMLKVFRKLVETVIGTLSKAVT